MKSITQIGKAALLRYYKNYFCNDQLRISFHGAENTFELSKIFADFLENEKVANQNCSEEENFRFDIWGIETGLCRLFQSFDKSFSDSIASEYWSGNTNGAFPTHFISIWASNDDDHMVNVDVYRLNDLQLKEIKESYQKLHED